MAGAVVVVVGLAAASGAPEKLWRLAGRVAERFPMGQAPVEVSGNRYLSKLYSDTWMIEKGYLNSS